MSDWYIECKKPMAGKLGEAIEEMCKEELICGSTIDKFAEKLKKHKVSKSFLKSELSRHHDFHNAWSGDDRYTHHDEGGRVKEVYPPKGDRNWHWDKNKLTDVREIRAWCAGYQTASGNCYERYNKIFLLTTMYLEQEK